MARTVFDTVKRRQCQTVSDQVCADATERKCRITQRPEQETVVTKQCNTQYSRECEQASDIDKQCNQEFEEECRNVPEQKL